MKFKVIIEKLKKGWSLSLPVASERKGRELVRELQARDATPNIGAKKLAKLKGSVKKIGSAYHVVIYRSKLKHATELVKESFIRNRDTAEAGA